MNRRHSLFATLVRTPVYAESMKPAFLRRALSVAALMLGVALVTSLNAVPAAGQASSTQNAFSMIIMSDPQYPWWRHGWDQDADVQDEADRTNLNTVNAINRIGTLGQWPITSTLLLRGGSPVTQPSGVIINGDLTAFWHKEQFEAHLRDYSQVRYPIYPGLGNHDYHNNTEANDDTCYYYTLNFVDPNRCAKEAVWWMANQIQFALPNVVNKDLPGYVAVRNTGAFVARFTVIYVLDGVIHSEPTDTFEVLQWRSIIIPRGATDIHVTLERHTGFSWAVVDSYEFPGTTVACYEVSGTTLDANSETTTCPKEWPNGASGSLAYSFDIGNFHFVQLHYHPGYENEFPFKTGQAFTLGIQGSPAFTVTPSYDWLRNDVQVASRAGRHVVINMHAMPGTGDDDELLDAIRDQNVVAIFSGHIHQRYGLRRTLNNGSRNIPVFYDGSVECERFLLVEFHPKYFNVGVINSSVGQPAFVQNNDDVCEPGGYYYDPDDLSQDIDYGINDAQTAPRTFVINRPPTMTSQLKTSPPHKEGAALSFDADGEDPDGDALTYLWSFGDGATVIGNAPQYIYADSGVYTVAVTATDGYGGVVINTFQLNIENAPPQVDAGPNQTVSEGSIVNLAPATFNDKGTRDTHTATINWGDGSSVEVGAVTETPFGPPGSTAGLTGAIASTHVYAEDGIYTVEVCLGDDDGDIGCDTLTATVANVAPTIHAGPDQTAGEGDEVNLAPATVSDQGTLDTHTATINWGDGTEGVGAVTETPFGPPGSTAGANGTVAGSHIYADNGDYTITVCVTDDGATTCDTLAIHISNIAPMVDAGPDQTTDEGDLVSLAPAAFSDPGSQDTHTAIIQWGDGTQEAGTITATPGGPGVPTTSIVSGSHIYADNGSYTLEVCVTDDDGATDCDTFVVTVNNVAPSVTLSGPATANEGETLAYTLLATDPGDDQFAFADGFPTCGDHGILSIPVLGGTTGVGRFECTFPDGPADSAVAIQVKDSDEAPSNHAALLVAVGNVIPSVSLDSIADETGLVIGVDVPGLINTQLTLEGQFSDPGPDAPYAVRVDWGDGAPNHLGDFAATRDVFASHVYDAPGNYTVTLSVTDKDGGVGQSSVVIIVLSPGDALEEVIEMLTPLADDPNIADAIEKLRGQKNGKARNGALDLLQQGNWNAALEKIKQALQELEAAKAADPTLDLLSAKTLLALAAKSVAVQALEDAERLANVPGEQQKVAQARQLLAEGDSLLASGADLLGAVSKYQEAVRQVQGIR